MSHTPKLNSAAFIAAGCVALFFAAHSAHAGTTFMCGESITRCHGADVAPIEGDGIVNVDDLLAVINTWAANGNDTGIRPQGDCAPQPFGDCEVDVDDLLNIIRSWGECNHGSCCLSNGDCAGFIPFTECVALQGSFDDHSSCFNNPECPQVQANDNCQNAFESTGPAQYTWYNAYATTDGPSGPPGGCEEEIIRDLWYRHTVTCPGSTKFSIGGGSGPYRMMSIYDGWDCRPTKLLACDGDDSSFNITLDLAVGQQVTIRLGSNVRDESPLAGWSFNITCVP